MNGIPAVACGKPIFNTDAEIAGAVIAIAERFLAYITGADQ